MPSSLDQRRSVGFPSRKRFLAGQSKLLRTVQRTAVAERACHWMGVHVGPGFQEHTQRWNGGGHRRSALRLSEFAHRGSIGTLRRLCNSRDVRGLWRRARTDSRSLVLWTSPELFLDHASFDQLHRVYRTPLVPGPSVLEVRPGQLLFEGFGAWKICPGQCSAWLRESRSGWRFWVRAKSAKPASCLKLPVGPGRIGCG
jgi:hypothetical protein